MRLGVSIPVEERIPATRLVELAQLAERRGFDTVVCGEVQGPEAMALLGAVAAATERVTIGSGVVPMATRGPVLTAMGFATLESLAPGRVFAGVGVSSPLVVEGWHGRTFEPPVEYVRQFLPALRRVLDGERLESGFRLTLELEARVPIVLAAMRPRMIELAGALADGVFLTWCPPGEAEERAALARRGAERAGRDPDELLVLVSYFAYAGPEPDVQLERMRRYLVQYATVPTHRDSFRGTLGNFDAIGEAWARGDRQRALELVSDEEVRHISVVGSAEDVVQRAREFHAAGIDLPILVAVAARPGDDAGPFATVEGVGRVLGGIVS